MWSLPNPPQIVVTVKNEEILPKDGWLKIRRSTLSFDYPDGEKSKDCVLDHVIRERNDAVSICAWYYDEEVKLHFVYLRSTIRPGIYIHKFKDREYDSTNGNRWELPAGLIERGETELDAAVRECEEEIGFKENIVNFYELGRRVFTCAAMSPERVYFVSIQVDPMTIKVPTEDGSPLEKYGQVIAIPLTHALKLVDEGRINGAITEIGLRRLAIKLDV